MDHDTAPLLAGLLTHTLSLPLLPLQAAELRLAVGCAMHPRLGEGGLCKLTIGSLAPDLQQSFGARLTTGLMQLFAQCVRVNCKSLDLPCLHPPSKLARQHHPRPCLTEHTE